MVFSSILFLFTFLPSLLIYYIVPKQYKNLTIMIISFVFYSWGEPRYFVLMIGTILVNYVFGIILDNFRGNKIVSKGLVFGVVFFDVGELFFFKYYNFSIQNINWLFRTSFRMINFVLPLGISFYIFQIMSYIVDVYRGKVRAERNLIDFAAFVVLFPQLIAGPIVKYTDINRELKERKISLCGIEEGIRLFIYGLGQKVLIANNVGLLWKTVEKIGFSEISSILAWMGIVAFALQIYFDFSGYSLMAIGLGKMLGFNFPKNFNYPYVARSITDFWRRWHMTLSFWFRDYLYIPLGGNRKGRLRTYFNLFVVWFITGFWHGASWNFIFWGLFFLVFLILEKQLLMKFLDRHKVFSHFYLVFLILVSWVLFAVDDFEDLRVFIYKLFCFDFRPDWIYYFRNYVVVVLIAIIFATPFVKSTYDKKIRDRTVLDMSISMTIFILSVAYLVDATYNPFLYFRF